MGDAMTDEDLEGTITAILAAKTKPVAEARAIIRRILKTRRSSHGGHNGGNNGEEDHGKRSPSTDT